MAARNHVAQVAGLGAINEPVVGHPEVIEHLAQVLGARVADESDHILRLFLLAAVTQRRAEQGANAGSSQDAFLAQQFARSVERIAVRDSKRLGDEFQIADRRHEILADSFHQPAARLHVLAFIHKRGQN